jgi:DNA repair ATPase RecN
MATLPELQGRLRQGQEALLRRKARRDALAADREQKVAALEKIKVEAHLLEQVTALLSQTAEQARQDATLQIEHIVTSALQAIFGPTFRFKVELVQKGGRAEAEFYVESSYGEGEPLRTKPQDSRGGGVVDVVSLALRIAMLESYRPRLTGPLVLDEPGKHVSDDYIQGVAAFVVQVSEHARRQVLMVTHNAHLAEMAQVAYRVTNTNGVSQVASLTRSGSDLLEPLADSGAGR